MFDSTVSVMPRSDLAERPPREMTAESSDDGLLARVAEGDRRAYAQLMDRHIDRAFGLARRVLGNKSDAEDVVQDAFLKVWQKAGQWQPGRAQFSTWLYRVVVNRCLDLKRKPVNAALDNVAEQSDDRPDAYEDIEARQRQARIAAAVAELPERQRTAVALSYTAGLSNAQAAETMEISVKAFESLLVRAKRELRERLAGDGEE
ncbi:MAG TPA: RNA polymerase sigma factor [Candidatus Binatia bacterium]|nr:RNA polymerase sigma factor [Candidatus Binatia bacterium]